VSWRSRFASGREALVALARALGLPLGTRVLLPALVPEGIIAPFLKTGCHVLFYPLDENLDPQYPAIDELLRRERPELAVFIHYFGLRKDVIRFTGLCHQCGTMVVEDMAHILRSKAADMNSEADFVLHSLTKMLPVPDGAVLEMKPKYATLQLQFRRDLRHSIYLTFRIGELMLCTVRHSIGSQRMRKMLSVLYYLLPSYRVLMSYFTKPHRMSALSRQLLRHIAVPEIVSHRRHLERLYEQGLSPRLFKRFVENASEGQHCKMGFPVRVADRNSLCQWLRDHDIQGVFFQTCWDFAPDLPKFCVAKQLMREHFLFPTAAHLSDSEILYVIEIANEWPIDVP
jgi:dTDP-4-amino-4,6-dideoxygalactose transaminase